MEICDSFPWSPIVRSGLYIALWWVNGWWEINYMSMLFSYLQQDIWSNRISILKCVLGEEMKHVFVPLITNLNTWKLCNRSRVILFIFVWISELYISLGVDATHTCCSRDQNKQLPPPPQLPGTLLSVPTPRRRQRRGWALRRRCSSQQLAFYSV